MPDGIGRATGKMPAAVVVDEATEADVADFAAFFRRAWAEAGPYAPGFAGATEEAIAELATRDAIVARIDGPEWRMFLGRVDGEVSGFAATRRCDELTVELAGVIVMRSAEGRGIGTRLVERALETANGDGYLRVIVRTETSNQRALSSTRRRGLSAPEN